jgi:hypothetical protein
MTADMVHVVEHLPGKSKALSSNTRIIKKKKKTKREKEHTWGK